MTRFTSSSAQPDAARRGVAAALQQCLVDGIDLHSQVKVAHWNIKGAHFAALHPLFDRFAGDVAERNDELAERMLTLGQPAAGTVRHVAAHSRLPEYPADTTRDLAHVEALVQRFDGWLAGLRAARDVADEVRDLDSSDLLTGIVRQFEQHAWFLRATLEQ